MKPAVAVSELSHEYPGKRGEPPRRALDGVSFEVGAGETFGLLGPNGCGKSTLFRILSTYFAPTSGRAELFGLDASAHFPALRRRIGVVFQNPSLDAKLTVRENMEHQGRLYGLSGEALRGRISELLERYGLSRRSEDLAGSLSGGLKRRVELAKGLLHHPELVLLDEPSTGLDPGARKDLWDHLRQLKDSRQTTILLTTHLMDEAENCDRLVLLDRGSLAAQGAPKELKAEIGGDVITIESHAPELLVKAISERFGAQASQVDGLVRLERPHGHALIPQLVEAFPGLVKSVSLSKPSLEDVFLHHTGHRFWWSERPPEAP